MFRVNLKSALIGIAATTIAALVVLSAFDSYQRQRDIDASNQLLANLERQIADVNPGIYTAYVGVYRLEPDFNIAITSDGDRLFAQGSNQIKVEIYPASESTYFNNYTEALIVFEKPAQGVTNQFVLHQINKIRHGRRI